MSRPKGWHKEDIKAEVRKRGSSLRAISKQAGKCHAAASVALQKPFPRLQREISDFVGVPLHVLWPQWYNEAGQRITTQSPKKASRKAATAQCKKSVGVSA